MYWLMTTNYLIIICCQLFINIYMKLRCSFTPHEHVYMRWLSLLIFYSVHQTDILPNGSAELNKNFVGNWLTWWSKCHTHVTGSLWIKQHLSSQFKPSICSSVYFLLSSNWPSVLSIWINSVSADEKVQNSVIYRS